MEGFVKIVSRNRSKWRKDRSFDSSVIAFGKLFACVLSM